MGDTSPVPVTAGQTGATQPSDTVGESTTVAGTDDDDDDDNDDNTTTTNTDTSSDVGESGETDDDDDDDHDTEAFPDTGGTTDTGEVLSPCCQNVVEPGCADPVVEQCVCKSDPFCCSNSWDALCIESAVTNCGIDCHNEGSCCAPSNAYGCAEATIESCVCNLEPDCCSVSWSVECMFLATDSCMADCFSGIDCCAGAPDEPGCEEPQVWECVCSTDTYCCEVEWDATCVVSAEASCGLMCP